jgi:hypothetical protein
MYQCDTKANNLFSRTIFGRLNKRGDYFSLFS